MSVYNVTIDHNDIPRPQHALFDIGAYEYNDLHVGPLEHLKQLLVYPNPFEDCITLCCSIKHKEANSISLFDLSGKCVYKAGSKSLKHCLGHLDSGLYFISVDGADVKIIVFISSNVEQCVLRSWNVVVINGNIVNRHIISCIV